MKKRLTKEQRSEARASGARKATEERLFQKLNQLKPDEEQYEVYIDRDGIEIVDYWYRSQLGELFNTTLPNGDGYGLTLARKQKDEWLHNKKVERRKNDELNLSNPLITVATEIVKDYHEGGDPSYVYDNITMIALKMRDYFDKELEKIRSNIKDLEVSFSPIVRTKKGI